MKASKKSERKRRRSQPIDGGAVGVEEELVGSSASRLRTLISTGRPAARELSRESLLVEGERKE